MKTLALISTAAALAAAGASATAAAEAPAELVYVSGRLPGARAYVVREDGTGKRRLTTSRYSESELEYSRDGKRIVFTSIRGGNQDIYVMNADGTAVRRITTHSQSDFNPTWSPDGKRIAYVSLRSGNFKIYVANADGAGNRLLTKTPNWVGNAAPSWSPDGRWIAFSSTRLKDGNPEIFKMRPDGSQVTRLTFTDTSGEVSPDDGFPSWSPDGRSIVFSSTRANGQHDLWIMRSDGKNPRRLTNTPKFDDWMASFSPDGRRIVFHGVAFRGDVSDVYVVNVDGSGLRRIVPGLSAVWRP
jgi:Tol biopolymer transport system component